MNPESLGLKDFRDNFAPSMERAAEQAGVELLPDEIAISIRGDFVIAHALIAAPAGVRLEEADKISLVYLSYPAPHACAARIPSGFYTLERISEPYAKNPRGKLVNLDGEAVWEIPLNIREVKVEPKPDAPERITFAEATIVQAQTNMSDTLISAHKTICYDADGVWYWIWGEFNQ